MEVQKMNDDIIYLALIGIIGGLVLASSVILFYIRYQRRFVKQQREIQKAELEHKQQLLNSIIHSQEEERMRISKDLHDHVGSSLSGLRLMVSRIMSASADASAMKEIAERTKGSIDDIINDVRSISHSLSPAGLELLGFNDALEEYCEKTAAASALNIKLTDNTNGILMQLSFDDALSLFRVMQELINNTIKHAQAKSVAIAITQNTNNIIISYSDDGIGVDTKSSVKAHGIGMYNIESRLSIIQANYTVLPPEEKGYLLQIRLPIPSLKIEHKNG